MKTKIKYILPLLAVMISAFHSTAQTVSATIAGMSGGNITVEQLSGDSMLRVTEPGFVVVAFTMSAYTKNYKPVELKSSSANLTALMREAISHSKSGTKIYFEYIEAKDAQGKTVKAKPIAFAIMPVSFPIK